jgi:hypothetical protein
MAATTHISQSLGSGKVSSGFRQALGMVILIVTLSGSLCQHNVTLDFGNDVEYARMISLRGEPELNYVVSF